ncbi:hypothetical protein Emag_005885 [Eimeria magna]
MDEFSHRILTTIHCAALSTGARGPGLEGDSGIRARDPAGPESGKALGGLLAPRARHDEEDSDEVVKARPALPTPASSGVSADLEGPAELSPLPAPRAPGSGRAAPQTAPTSPAAPPPGGSAEQRPLEPLSPATVVAFAALGTLAAQGWDCMVTRCVWWTLAAARDYRTARENFEYRLQELQWVNSLSRTVAAAHAVLTSPSQGQSSAEALVGQLRREQLGRPAVTEDQVERLVGFWLSRAGRPSNFTSTPEEATPPPPLPHLGIEEFRLPESAVTARNPPQQLGMDGLLNGSAGRSPADDASVGLVGQETGTAAELSETKQPAPKRARTPGR